MIKIFSSNAGVIEENPSIIPGCWVKVINPTPEELTFLETQGINKDYLKYALDEDELSRFETEANQTLMIIDLPVLPKLKKAEIHSTIPVAFIITENYLVSVALHENLLFDEIEKIPNLTTANKGKAILQFLGRLATKYMLALKEIDQTISAIEKRALKSISNSEILELMNVQKSLVYITTSLKANELTLDRILHGRVLTISLEDANLVEDVLIEIRQAREMADIHERILGNTMDNYGSIIANNLNDIMKVLTSFTLLLSIPMIIFGFYGMNVGGLWFDELPYFAIGLSAVIMIILAILFVRKKLL